MVFDLLRSSFVIVMASTVLDEEMYRVAAGLETRIVSSPSDSLM